MNSLTIKCMLLFAVLGISAYCGADSMYGADNLSTETQQNIKQRTIKGVVFDEDGYPIPGAAVQAAGKVGTPVVTDVDGNFTISVGTNIKSIIISSFGMISEEVSLTDPKMNLQNLKVVLKFENNQLDQIVVTGYAQTTTKKITGSVGIVNSDKLKDKPVTSVDAMLSGEVAGVTVQATSGRPGAQSSIRIRGTNNLSGNSSPLWVVDGVPLQNDVPDLSSEQIKTGGFDNVLVNGIGSINPNDIENITILKDAAAAAIYGSRAANGVIVVTTKRGKSGRINVSYSNNFQVSFAPSGNNNRMNSSEKLAWEQEIWDEFSQSKYLESLDDNSVFFPIIGVVGQIRAGVGNYAHMKGDTAAQDAYIESLKSNNTNWYKHLFRNAFSMNHHISISGGSDKSTYYVSAGYTTDNGMLIHNNYDRYNFTSTVTATPNNVIKFEAGADISYQTTKMPSSYVDPFTYAYFANPYQKAYNEDGSYAGDDTYFSLGYYNGNSLTVLPKEGFSILRELDNNYTDTKFWSNTVRGNAVITILPVLKFNGLVSYTFSNNKSDDITAANTYSAFKDRLGNDKYSQNNVYGSIAQNSTNRHNYVARGHFMYNQTFNDSHTVNAIAGAEIRGSKLNTIFTKRYNYDPKTGNTALPPISGESDAWLRAVEALNGEYFSENKYASFYASVDYFYKDKYVLNASFRQDGSSNFGSDRQFNPTWSAGVAWHINNENFLKSSNVISNLTWRAAAGYTGDVNSSVSPYLIMEYYRQQFRYYDDEQYLLGRLPSAPNPKLRWEKTFDVKTSIDLGLFKERLTFNIEGYYRKSTDVVTSSQVLSTTGFYTQKFNSADILNSGIEGTIAGKIINRKNGSLSASVNIAYNYNKVTKYNPGYASKISVRDRYVEGYPVGAILSGKLTGIDPETGLYSFRLRPDANITTSTDLNKADNYRYYLGTTIASVTGGFNITGEYKSLRLSVSGFYSLGAKRYDKINSPASYSNPRHEGVSTEKVQSQYSDIYSSHLNVNRDITDRWTASNPNAKYPRLYDYFGYKYNFDYYNVMDYNIVDAIYLKDISYLRIRNIVLTYSFPNSITKKLGMSNLSFNLSLNNFFTITGYDGMDPEVPGATYPTTKSVSFGMNIGF